MEITKEIMSQMISEKKEFVVHCDDKEMTKDFLSYLQELGVCLAGGKRLDKLNTDRTSFRLNNGSLHKGHRDTYEVSFAYLTQFEWIDVLNNSIEVAFNSKIFEEMLGV